MTTMTKWIWAFVLGVALADVVFTWECRGSVVEWEANPVACRAFQGAGVVGAIIYRAVWLGYAGVMSRMRTRFSWLIPVVWGLGHLYLLATLLQAYPYMAVLHS